MAATSVAVEAGKARPRRLSDLLDRSRAARKIVVFVAVVGSALLAWAGTTADERILEIDENKYVAVAALFVAALAIERLTELLIAPWVGTGDRAIDRSIMIGSLSLVLGVGLSVVIGLSVYSITGQPTHDLTAWERWLDLVVAGAAISGGAKPLHDLITRIEQSAADARGEKTGGSAPETEPPSSSTEPSPLEPAAGGPPGAHELALLVTPQRAQPGGPGAIDLNGARKKLETMLPGWLLAPTGTTPWAFRAWTFVSETPGSPEHRRQAFAAAYRVTAEAGVEARPEPTRPPPGPPASHDRRWAHEALRLGPLLKQYKPREASADDPPVVALLDTGMLPNELGVVEARWSEGPDVIGGDDGGSGADTTWAKIKALLARFVLAFARPLGLGGVVSPRVANMVVDGFDVDFLQSPNHATSVGSVIAAGGDEQLRASDPHRWWRESPMIGIAPDAKVLSIRVMEGPVHLFDDDVVKGIDAAIAAKVDVISMSLGGFGFDGLEDAIERATKAGIIVVAAAGNSFNVVVDPAAYGTTVAVAGITPEREPFQAMSSRGPEVDVAAPAKDVWRATFDDSGKAVVEPGTGTTYATACTAGVAALWIDRHGRSALRARYPGDQLPKAFKYLLRKTAEPIPGVPPETWGQGIPNVAKLLEEPLPTDADLAAADPFEDRRDLSQVDRVLGGIAAVFTGQGTIDVRAQAVAAAAGGVASKPDAAETAAKLGTIPPLIAAEAAAHARHGATGGWVGGGAEAIATPATATPELRALLKGANGDIEKLAIAERRGKGELDHKWGVGFSAPLKAALQGRSATTPGYAWFGIVLLAAAGVVAWFGAADPDSGFSFRGDGAGLVAAFGFLVVGVYGLAQGVERVLEFTVARVAFRDVPGREVDRALILLGFGVLFATSGAVLLDIGLLTSVAPITSDTSLWHEDDIWFDRADALVTGLATGGGAKPVHDLLTRIRRVTPSSPA